MQIHGAAGYNTNRNSLPFKHAEKLGPIGYGGLTQQQLLTYHEKKLAWDGIVTFQHVAVHTGRAPFQQPPAYGVIKIENVS